MEIKSRVPGKIVRFEKQVGSRRSKRRTDRYGSNENETAGSFSGSRHRERIQSSSRGSRSRRPGCCYC